MKLIAFYLPQFHPIPENDAWWGTGFTDWRNVRKAIPNFVGHEQPRVPTELGYYDLRSPETRATQAALASAHGIHGFCYYYYWFAGRRLLAEPLAEVVRNGAPEFPFCVCWANENWSKRWDGGNNEVLIEQSYSAEHDRQLVKDLAPIFAIGAICASTIGLCSSCIAPTCCRLRETRPAVFAKRRGRRG